MSSFVCDRIDVSKWARRNVIHASGLRTEYLFEGKPGQLTGVKENVPWEFWWCDVAHGHKSEAEAVACNEATWPTNPLHHWRHPKPCPCPAHNEIAAQTAKADRPDCEPGDLSASTKENRNP